MPSKLDNNKVQRKEIGTPAENPPAGYVFEYFKADGLLYRKNSAGDEIQIGIGIEQLEQLAIIGKGTGASKTTTTIIGNSLVEEFGIGDELFLHWVLPTNIDKNIDSLLLLALAPTGAEVGKKISFDISILSVELGIDISITTGTIQFIDEDIPDTLDEAFQLEKDILAQTFLGENVSALHIKIKRVASSADPVNDIALHHSQMFYNIK